MNMTHHAQTRIQQRGIPSSAVDAILAFGCRKRHRGADVYFLDRQARSRMANSLGRKQYAKIERSLDSYLVVGDDGAIITAAHRKQRLKF